MPDWKPSVHQCLSGVQLSREQYDELVAEVSAHLEDRFEELRSQGITEENAIKLCLEEIADLNRERSHIQNAKGLQHPMNIRTRTIWLPGFVSVAISSLLMMAIEFLTFFRTWVSVSNQVTYAYVAWLVLLPFCGAAGAMLSRRGNGSLLARLTSGLFPSLIMCSVFVLVIPFDLLATRNAYVISHPLAVLQAMAMWVIAPAIALLAGAAPFCRVARAQVIHN